MAQAIEFQKHAQQCCREAEKAISRLERDKWLKLAAEWAWMAKHAESYPEAF